MINEEWKNGKRRVKNVIETCSGAQGVTLDVTKSTVKMGHREQS